MVFVRPQFGLQLAAVRYDNLGKRPIVTVDRYLGHPLTDVHTLDNTPKHSVFGIKMLARGQSDEEPVVRLKCQLVASRRTAVNISWLASEVPWTHWLLLVPLPRLAMHTSPIASICLHPIFSSSNTGP